MWLLKRESTQGVDTVVDFDQDEDDALARIRCPLCDWRPGGSSRWCCLRTPFTGEVLWRMRNRVEHVLDARALSRLSVPVAMDEMLAL